jgi:hypothetical protein
MPRTSTSRSTAITTNALIRCRRGRPRHASFRTNVVEWVRERTDARLVVLLADQQRNALLLRLRHRREYLHPLHRSPVYARWLQRRTMCARERLVRVLFLLVVLEQRAVTVVFRSISHIVFLWRFVSDALGRNNTNPCHLLDHIGTIAVTNLQWCVGVFSAYGQILLRQINKQWLRRSVASRS